MSLMTKLNSQFKVPALLSVLAVLILSASAFAAPSKVLSGGDTSVSLSQELIAAAGSLNLRVRPLSPARPRGFTSFSFPITSGIIDFQNAKGEIIHAGGLRLTTANTTVNLRNFIIDTTGAQPVLTGIVTVNDSVVGRIPLFKLTLPALQLPIPDNFFFLNIPNVNVRLTAEAAAALNQSFGVTAFTENFPVGTAQVRTFTLFGFDIFRGDPDAAERFEAEKLNVKEFRNKEEYQALPQN